MFLLLRPVSVIMSFRIKRAYEAASREDGTRVLVDRLWPRGVTKGEAHINLWLKDIAPSKELRLWFGHDPSRWTEFRSRYLAELHSKTDLIASIRNLLEQGTVTLVYGAKDEKHNHAVVLLERLSRS
jgi:uncharacterized protein YeaO (DUF488 family)